MNSIYFYYYLWLFLTIIFLLGGIKLFTYKKKEGTRPFAIGVFMIGIISIISIINSPSLGERISYFKEYSLLSSEDLKSIEITEINNEGKAKVLNSQKDISQVLTYLQRASPSYFVFGSGEVKKQFEIELKANKGSTYFIRAKIYEKVVIIDFTIGENKKFIGRYTNSHKHFF